MPLYDIGERGYLQAQAVDTLPFSPLSDRAAIVKRILIDKASAPDVWVVSTQGRELARFDIQATGNQQPLAGPYSGFPKTNDLFSFYNAYFPDELIYPVPQGMTLTVASVGGATANISISFQEVTPGEITAGLMNHPLGSRIVCPLVGYRAATVTAAGENVFDTQIGPNWFPDFFVDGQVPVNWNVHVKAMFLEGGGVNTYDGSADAQSTTTYLAVIKGGQRLFTRDALGGIPLVGAASAGGSGNTVIGTDTTPLPPFQEATFLDTHIPAVPLMLSDGSTYQFRLNVAGDVTGGADYSAMRQLFLVDVRFSGGF